MVIGFIKRSSVPQCNFYMCIEHVIYCLVCNISDLKDLIVKFISDAKNADLVPDLLVQF